MLAILQDCLNLFRQDARGNVAVTFAIATLPVIGAVGAAVDYSRANSVKSAMQAALDSTALMLARDAATLTAAQIQTKASDYFNAMFARPDVTGVTLTATYSSNSGSQVVVNGSAQVPTALMQIAGYNFITVRGSSTSKWGAERLRVALALDVTGSMAYDGKLDALKTAAKSLLSQLKSAAATNGDVYVSIIPFERDVNIGSNNYNASYLNWTDWDEVNGSCSSSYYSTKTSCQSAGRTWTTASHSTWNGCVTDRNQNYDQDNSSTSTSSRRFYPHQHAQCPSASAMALTYDWTNLNDKIDALVANGSTNQPIGLVWGWHSLHGNGPMSMPVKDTNYTYREYIILMSDGLNTENRWVYGNQSAVDKRMYDATNGGSGTCANIKAAGIKIYAIQVDTNGDGESAIMKNCANDSSMFWRITSSGDLVTIFSQIGTQISKLRVAY